LPPKMAGLRGIFYSSMGNEGHAPDYPFKNVRAMGN